MGRDFQVMILLTFVKLISCLNRVCNSCTERSMYSSFTFFFFPSSAKFTILLVLNGFKFNSLL